MNMYRVKFSKAFDFIEAEEFHLMNDGINFYVRYENNGYFIINVIAMNEIGARYKATKIIFSDRTYTI